MTKTKIHADRILMELDGPALFICNGQLSNTLLLKIDETINSNVFISTTLCQRMETALLNSEISVRGVFNASNCIQAVELDFQHNLVSRAPIYDQKYLDTLLPSTGVGLSIAAGAVPDALINEDAILTLYLQGKNIGRNRMRLSVLRNNINQTSNIIRTAMLGADLANKRSSSIDPIVEEPVFGSLMISVVSAHMNFEYIHKLSKYKNLSRASFDQLMEKETSDFIAGLSDLKLMGGGLAHQSRDFDDIYDLIEKMLPSEDSDIEKITFFVPKSPIKKVSFELKDSVDIRLKLRSDNYSTRTFKGKIDQVTMKAASIRVERPLGKQITCQISDENFETYKGNTLFKTGSFVQVSGEFEPRDRIDMLHRATVDLISATKF